MKDKRFRKRNKFEHKATVEKYQTIGVNTISFGWMLGYLKRKRRYI